MIMFHKSTNLLAALALILFSSRLMAANLQPFADTHLHYNDDQAEIIETGDALRVLIENNVVFGVVSSRPPALALELESNPQGRKVRWSIDMDPLDMF